MCNPDRCCQVRKTKGNREHRYEFNIETSKGNYLWFRNYETSLQRTTAIKDTDNQMNLHEHEIRDNWKIETKVNNKDPYIQSCHY